MGILVERMVGILGTRACTPPMCTFIIVNGSAVKQ